MLLKRMRANGRKCLCDMKNPCPCDEFIDNGKCRCRMFLPIE
jgi:hypothetical protein